ncbi:Unknown protein sequence [Pseudomonas amygdali pv. lachrymans]|uniref:Uncharacterized protein n=1 Tax=Pseudomonas amygdali pv. lachrymans TaxID=53707 RepID=A0ABR5KSQ5_PSEAV|nr:Unknown protein sequence [Pseudomonas amygdali pv. lachrymans]
MFSNVVNNRIHEDYQTNLAAMVATYSIIVETAIVGHIKAA